MVCCRPSPDGCEQNSIIEWYEREKEGAKQREGRGMIKTWLSEKSESNERAGQGRTQDQDREEDREERTETRGDRRSRSGE